MEIACFSGVGGCFPFLRRFVRQRLLLTRHNNIEILEHPRLLQSVKSTVSSVLLQRGDVNVLFSFHSLWKIVKFVLIVQVFNAVIDFSMWVAYDYAVSAWTVATLTVFATLLVLAIKVAVDRVASFPK